MAEFTKMSHSIRASGKGDPLQLPGLPPGAGPIRQWILEHLASLEISTILGAICLPAVIIFLVIRSQAGTLSGQPVRAHAPVSVENIPADLQAPSPSAVFGDLKTAVDSVRIVTDAMEEFRTSVRIEIKNTHPHHKDDDFEFARLECELSDNFGNIYRPIPPSDLERGLYDRRPLYPHQRRSIDIEFDRPVSGIGWLEFRMAPPTRRSRGGARLRFGIPASLIAGLEKLNQRRPIISFGCEED
jgi:hypothetical protein